MRCLWLNTAALSLTFWLWIGCSKAPDELTLVVTDVTHFNITAGPEALSFPIFIGYESEERLCQETRLAEGYYRKLSQIYDLKSFRLVDNSHVPLVLNKISSASKDKGIYKSTANGVEIELLLGEWSPEIVQYHFRIKQGDGKWREQLLAVPVGQSCSVGVLTDSLKQSGHLLSLAVRALQVTPAVSMSDAVAFMHRVDSTVVKESSRTLSIEERECIGELFGGDALKAQAAVDIALNRSLINFDTPMQIIGGAEALGKAIKYPASAKKDRFMGIVLVGMNVGTDGSPRDIHIVKSAREDLDTAAVEALRTVRFTPAYFKGEPVEAEVVVPISFKLK